jgi:hypothetical protein
MADDRSLQPSGDAAGATADDATSILALIQSDTRETLELVRALVQLLLPTNEPKQGPSLEELIAALVALQRDQMILLRQLQADIGAVLDRLPESSISGEGLGYDRRPPNGNHRA